MTADGQRSRIEPIPGEAPQPAGAYSLDTFGYREQEYLFAGEADSFALEGERSRDGRWSVRPDARAEFATRLVVRRPIDPSRFSGCVVLEWLNVSGGMDGAPDWTMLHRAFVERGDVWVGMSVQKVGIDGGGFVEGAHLKKLDPQRYGALVHPGDEFAFDMFSQAGRLLRGADDASPRGDLLGGPLGGLTPQTLIAAGESQSASFLVSYINAVDPKAAVFDAYFVHGRPGSGADFDGKMRLSISRDGGVPTSAGEELIRADARVPVLVYQSETDVILLGSGKASQPDGDRVRLWELAGAAHADTYMLVAGPRDDGTLAPEQFAKLLRPISKLLIGTAESPINAAPQHHYVGQAAYEHLLAWAAGGAAPPVAPRLELTDDGSDLAREADGIALGGIRTPWVDVPLATLTGLGQRGEMLAVLFGRTLPFSADELTARYPGGREDYLRSFEKSLDATIAAGFIRSADRAEILAVAGPAFDNVT